MDTQKFEAFSDNLKDSVLLAHIERYTKYGEKIEKYVEENPRLQKPLNNKLIGILAVCFLLSLPLLFITPRAGIPEEKIFEVVSIYLPIIMTIGLFFVNQRLLVPMVFSKKKVWPFVVANIVLAAILVLLRDNLLMLLDMAIAPAGQSFFMGWTMHQEPDGYGWVRLIVFLGLNFFSCFVNLALFAFGAQVQYFYRRHIRRQARLQAELSFLKMQINQHFLFNTMNNIIAMMDIDSARAKKLMLSLSKILRTMLYETKSQTIPVSKEVDILKDYAELEKLHFGNDLDFELEVNLKNPEAKVVPMLLLPLVENVFKHSLNVKGRSFVKLSIEECDGVLTYRSENSNFPRETKRDDHHGVGLANLQKRLDTVYAGRYEYVSGIEGDAYKAYLKVTL